MKSCNKAQSQTNANRSQVHWRNLEIEGMIAYGVGHGSSTHGELVHGPLTSDDVGRVITHTFTDERPRQPSVSRACLCSTRWLLKNCQSSSTLCSSTMPRRASSLISTRSRRQHNAVLCNASSHA